MALETTQEPAPAGASPFQKDCARCGHVTVCTIFRAVVQLMAKWPDDNRPFEAVDLAKICKKFQLKLPKVK